MCYYCKGNHSFLVCPKGITNTIAHFANCETSNFLTKSANLHSDAPNSSTIITNAKNDEFETFTNAAVTKNGNVALKCIRTIISNSNDSEKFCKALVMFDDGSTHSFISSKLALALNLPTRLSTTLNLNTFANQKQQIVTSTVVDFCVTLFNKSKFALHGYVLPMLTSQISYIPVENDYTDGNVALQHGTLDVLIGSNLYYQLNVKPLRTLKNGFTLIQSKLGYIIAGTNCLSSAFYANASFTNFVKNDTINDDIDKNLQKKSLILKENFYLIKFYYYNF